MYNSAETALGLNGMRPRFLEPRPREGEGGALEGVSRPTLKRPPTLPDFPRTQLARPSPNNLGPHSPIKHRDLPQIQHDDFVFQQHVSVEGGV